MVEILLDASFLIVASTRPLMMFNNIEEVLGKSEFIVLKCVLDELKAISSKSTKKGRDAQFALRYAEHLTILDYPKSGGVDETLLQYAYDKKAVVATLDRALIKRLRAEGLPVLTCRKNRVILA